MRSNRAYSEFAGDRSWRRPRHSYKGGRQLRPPLMPEHPYRRRIPRIRLEFAWKI